MDRSVGPGRVHQRTVRGSSAFPTTAWSVVSKARLGLSAESRSALAELCEAYWQPLYVYARRRGQGADEARDLTQGYFAVLLEKDYLGDVRPREGRFRAFLLASFRNFLSKERDRSRALKRGGGAVPLSIDAARAEAWHAAEPVESRTPEAVFERRWALTVLERALDRLRREAADARRGEEFERLHGYLTGREPRTPYREVAAELGMSEGAVKVAVHRLRQRFGRLLRAEIAATVADPGQVDDELRHLLAVIRPWEPGGHP
jgi:RNA polymerase sigma-70 factor (ECF subfamily)